MKKTNSIQVISQNGAVREIVHYLFWQPTYIHFAGDIITVGTGEIYRKHNNAY
jgi:hypothetical protein